MTGTMTLLVICLTVICLACLILAALMVWWTMDSGGQHSISARKQSEMALSSMQEMVGQTAQIVTSVTDLTEILLLGREMPAISQPLEPQSPPEILLTPDDVWTGLPAGIQETLLREQEEAGIWQSPSEQRQHGSGVVVEPTLT